MRANTTTRKLMDMEKLIYTYALVRAYQKENNDYLETFSPFVLLFLKERKFPVDIASIQKGVYDSFELTIPEHVLRTILQILVEKKYLFFTKTNYRITDKGYNLDPKNISKIHPSAPNIMEFLKRFNIGVERGLIAKYLEENYDICLDDSLKNVLRSLESQGYIQIIKEQYELTSLGYDYSNTFETLSEVENRLEPFFDELTNFLNINISDKGEDHISKDIARNLLISFIHRNIGPMVEYVSDFPDMEKLQHSCKLIHHDKEILLCDFSRYLYENKMHLYLVLKDLILGSLISIVINNNEFTKDCFTVTHSGFENFQVFLDTNILFSLLRFHFDDFSKPIHELFNLMKSWKFDIRVFDFTLEEAALVINNCIRDLDYYNPNMRVNSICAYLRSRNLDRYKMKEIINHIEDDITKMGIKVEKTNIKLKEYNPEKSKAISIQKYKQYQGVYSQKHDLAAIDLISKLRNTTPYKLEDASPIFLTADGKLAEYDIKETNRIGDSIPEVFVDRLMTNIIWLINPSTNISVESLIATCSRNRYISLNIWHKFLNLAKELYKEGRLSYEDVSNSIYSDHVYMILRNLEEDDIDKIDQEMVRSILKKPAEDYKKLRSDLKAISNTLEETRNEFNTLKKNYRVVKTENEYLSKEKHKFEEKLTKIEIEKENLENNITKLKGNSAKELNDLNDKYYTISGELEDMKGRLQKTHRYIKGTILIFILIGISYLTNTYITNDLGTISSIITIIMAIVTLIKMAFY